MKKMKYILPILLMSLFSCSDFLDRDAENEVSNDELFRTIEGAEFALTGLYASMTDSYYYGENMVVIPEFKSGNIKFSDKALSSEINKYTDSYNFTHVEEELNNDDISLNFYQHLYKVLNQANNIIKYLPGIETNNTVLKDQIMGEALVLRALIHFDISRLYAQPYIFSANGDHPGIVTLLKPIDVFDQPSRDRLYETYGKIKDDLTDAIPLLKGNRGGDISKALVNVDVANGMMARVCLYMNDWENAETYATAVINNSSLELVPNDDLVEEWKAHTPSSEDIWVLNMSNNSSYYISEVFGKAEEADGDIKRNTATISKDLYDLFDANDARINLFESVNHYGTSDTVSLKFTNLDQNERFVPLMRLSEMYLIRAEARAENNQDGLARIDLDEVIKRANPDALTSTESGQDLVDKILLERRKELCLEGHTYFDFIRKEKGIVRNDFNGTANANVDFGDYKLILPIPRHEIEYNSEIEQNEGYIDSQNS